jgi:hypothetical protein
MTPTLRGVGVFSLTGHVRIFVEAQNASVVTLFEPTHTVGVQAKGEK